MSKGKFYVKGKHELNTKRKVHHDGTLTGKGTKECPLSVAADLSGLDLSAFETISGAEEKIAAALETAKDYTDEITADKLGEDERAADSALLNGKPDTAFLQDLRIGTTETLPPGSDATASVSVADGVGIVDFGIPAGEQLPENMLLLMSPHLWEVGREYDFGDGSFGQRFTGTITAAENEGVYQILMPLPSIPTGRLYILGGCWCPENDFNRKVAVGNTGQASTNARTFVESTVYFGINNLAFYSKSQQARTNAPYDISVRYTKG